MLSHYTFGGLVIIDIIRDITKIQETISKQVGSLHLRTKEAITRMTGNPLTGSWDRDDYATSYNMYI